MSGIYTFVTNMNKGELDPQMMGRFDLAAYYNGLAEATNVLSLPQGGVRKRPGMKFLDDPSQVFLRMESFINANGDEFILAFSAGRIYFYRNEARVTNINGSGLDYIVTPYNTGDFIRELDFIQSSDSAVIVHKNQEPYILVTTGLSTWTLAPASLVNIPSADFDDALSPTPTDNIQDVQFIDIYDGSVITLTLNGETTGPIAISPYASPSATANNIRSALQALNVVGGSGVSVTSEAFQTYRVTFEGRAANDWDLMIGVLVVFVPVVPDSDEEILISEIQAGSPRKEPVWSATRGWPATATFHEGRLWFGGSAARPATIWGSRVGDFFNFDNGTGLDDEGITAVLDNDQANRITAIFSSRSFQIFTTKAEFYVPESPITPSNISIKTQGRHGSKRVAPVSVDGSTVFVQATGKVLNSFFFINELQANQTESLSIMAPHLINNPNYLRTKLGTENDDANYIYLLGESNNQLEAQDMTVFNTLGSQDVIAFTRWSTEGTILGGAVADGKMHFIVSRGVNKTYIEVEDIEMNTDSGVRQFVASGGVLGGLSHLEGRTVKIKVSGAVQDDQVVSGGQITFSQGVGIVEAGLPYFPKIQTMPINIQGLPGGPNYARKKRIMRAAVNVYESNGVIVNGQRLADKTIGQNQFDSPAPQTGLKRIHLSGWSLEAQLEITQDTPMFWQILSIGMEVKS